MLVLTRKPGQSILIGDGIEVQILSTAGEKVRVGITAPRDVAIFRNEVKERIDEEKREGDDEESSHHGNNGNGNVRMPSREGTDRVSPRS